MYYNKANLTDRTYKYHSQQSFLQIGKSNLEESNMLNSDIIVSKFKFQSWYCAAFQKVMTPPYPPCVGLNSITTYFLQGCA